MACLNFFKDLRVNFLVPLLKVLKLSICQLTLTNFEFLPLLVTISQHIQYLPFLASKSLLIFRIPQHTFIQLFLPHLFIFLSFIFTISQHLPFLAPELLFIFREPQFPKFLISLHQVFVSSFRFTNSWHLLFLAPELLSIFRDPQFPFTFLSLHQFFVLQLGFIQLHNAQFVLFNL